MQPMYETQACMNASEPKRTLLLPNMLEQMQAINASTAIKLDALEEIIYRLHGISRPKEDGSGNSVSSVHSFTQELDGAIKRASTNHDRLEELVSILQELV